MMTIRVTLKTTETKDCIVLFLARKYLINLSLNLIAVHIKESVKILANTSPVSLLTSGESIET